jgi:hypothetical protein
MARTFHEAAADIGNDSARRWQEPYWSESAIKQALSAVRARSHGSPRAAHHASPGAIGDAARCVSGDANHGTGHRAVVSSQARSRDAQARLQARVTREIAGRGRVLVRRARAGAAHGGALFPCRALIGWAPRIPEVGRALTYFVVGEGRCTEGCARRIEALASAFFVAGPIRDAFCVLSRHCGALQTGDWRSGGRAHRQQATGARVVLPQSRLTGLRCALHLPPAFLHGVFHEHGIGRRMASRGGGERDQEVIA